MPTFILTSELQTAILQLASQPDIKSISCPFDGFDLWEGLLREQVRRSKATGLPPQDALYLAGPDSGIPGVTAPRYIDDEDDGKHPPVPDPDTGMLAAHQWGGEVHIPYEGACGSDLFILPKWHNVFPERMLNPGAKLSYLLGGKKCNYLLTNRQLGELPCATRLALAGWSLYINSAAHEDCNPNRELKGIVEQRKEIVRKLISPDD